MGKIWKFNLGYRIFRFYADWCTGTTYRRIKIEGKEKVPADTPVILASNHCCTMMDAAVILYADDGATAFGARADIFHGTFAPVLRWMKMVPLARIRDGLSEVAKNYEVFDEVADCLGHEVPFCIYVEGTHRPTRGLQPVKKGVFRIATRAQQLTNKPVAIVPVGLAYESFFQMMTDVVVRFGDPVYIDDVPQSEWTSVLSERILGLIADYPKRHRFPLPVSIPLAIISIPLFVICSILCLPILLVTWYFKRKLKDMAWINTVRYACKVALLPFMLIAAGIIGFINFPWWGAVVFILLVAYSQSIAYLLHNFYKNIINDIKQ